MKPVKDSEACFACAICGGTAGRVRLLTAGKPLKDRSRPVLRKLADVDSIVRPKDQAALVVDTFFGVQSQPVFAENIAAVAKAIDEADASALYRIAYCYAPFHCPECAASYCGEHWNWRYFEDGPYSGVEGDCPSGHFHVHSY